MSRRRDAFDGYLNQREMEFREEQVLRTAVTFPSATWERGEASHKKYCRAQHK
jgi:hypothetical protein